MDMTSNYRHFKTILAGAILLAALLANCAFGESRFRQLTMADGLSNARVFSVLQDHQGYIWLATEDGLDRYDGYSITVFKNNPADPSSISSNLIKAIFEDSHNRLWIGTNGGGLNLFNPKNDSFQHFTHVPDNPDSLGSNNIWSLGSTSDGKLLIGTYDAGLDIFDPKTHLTTHFPVSLTNNGPSDNQINMTLRGKNSSDWIATQSGLDSFDDKKHTFTHYQLPLSKTEIIRGISEDQKGTLWIASDKGLQYLLPGNTAVKPASNDNNSPVSGNLSSVFLDSRGDLWVGSIDSGLYLKAHDSTTYIHFHQNTGDLTSLSSDSLWDIYEDNSGLIWATTDNGVNILDPRMEDTLFIRPLLVPGAGSLVSNHIGAVFNNDNSLWLASTAGIYRIPLSNASKNGSSAVSLLSRIDPKKYRIITSFLRLNNNTVLAATGTGWLLRLDNSGTMRQRWNIGKDINLRNIVVFGLIKKNQDTVYAATYGHGLLEYNLAKNRTTRIGGDSPISLSPDAKILESLEVQDKDIFIATTNGLFRVHLNNLKSELIPLNPDGAEPEPISLYYDKNHHLWVGTIRGLWRLTLDTNDSILARNYYAINNNSVSGIEPDTSGNLWLAGDNSVIRFNPNTGKMLNIGDAQNLPVSGFYAAAHAHTKNGWLWFGGPDGLIGLDPDRIKKNPIAPRVAISNVSISRDDRVQSFRPKDNKPLVLKYNDSLVTFDLAVLDYGFPQANTFSYRLVGSRSSWTPRSTAHQIIFPSLEPGHYQLEVKGADNWGVWSKQPATLDIDVLPPWWKTWWAYALYILFILSAMFLYVRDQQQKLRKEREISAKLRDADAIKSNFVTELEAQVNRATGELKNTLEAVNLKNQELEIAHRRASEGEQLKSQFLANMSHELRTPLTAILGYLKLLLQTNASAEQTEYLRTVQHSSESLLAIINDTLDLSRIESGKLLIDEVDFDLLELIESTIELLGPSAYQKRITLLRIVPPEIPLNLRGDPLRIRQILTNLVGNAIKFTHSGSVCVRVQEIERREKDVILGIAVSDTGIGIPAASIAKLFDAYTRHQDTSQTTIEGTGLGLSICKKLLDLMGGEIEVLSTPGVGSTFEFRLSFRIQKQSITTPQFSNHAKIALYDNHPLSHQAWRASLSRFGLEVISIRNLVTLKERDVNALLVVMGIEDINNVNDSALEMGRISLPHFVLAPTADRKLLDLISETCQCRVQNTLIRESVLLVEIQMLIPAPQTHKIITTDVRAKTTYPIEEDQQYPVILVADDNAINRKLLATLLRQNNYRVLEAENGAELITLATSEHWDAALVDIHMPDMDGMEAAQKLISMNTGAHPPIIAVSADALPETRANARAAGMQDYLVKPYTEEQLLEMLKKHLLA